MENLRKALSTLMSITEKTDSALADDGKISISEGVGIAMSAIGLIKVVKNAKTIKQEYLALSDDDRTDLIAWFAAEFDITNDNIEQIVESIFSALLQLSVVFETVSV
ncbi:MAG: hypothetical protein QM503_06535 [Bacteroidota bacterium]